MSLQHCPSCGERNDVSIYVRGQWARCARCGIRFVVERRDGDPRSGPGLPAATPGGPAEPPTQVVAGAERARPSGSVHPITSSQIFPTPAQRPRAAREPSPPPGPDVPPEIPGYQCLALLGRGGMGEVWKARQLSLERVVAVKILAPSLAVEPDFVRRFERESNALAALAHPNVVAVFDRGSAHGRWYFVMEFVEGRSLRDRIVERTLTRADALRLLGQVARAVNYAHRRGVIHRDLKPENILLDHVGQAKVADFGLAGMSEAGRSDLTMTAVAMGTAHYMAPEQRRDAKNVDGRADLYSLGVMLYEVLTGELPVGRFPAPRERDPSVDPRLDTLVLRLLDPDPEKRPADGAEVAALLESLPEVAPEHRAEPASPPGRPPPPPNSRSDVYHSVFERLRHSRSLQLSAAAATLALAAAIGFALWRTPVEADGPLRFAAEIDRTQPNKASVALGRGDPEAFLAVGGGWRLEEEDLVRQAGRGAGAREPRAVLQALELDFSNAAAEADVLVESVVTGAAEAPRAEVLLYFDQHHHVGVRLALEEDAGFTLVATAPSKGEPATRTLQGTGAPAPDAGRRVRLAVTVVNGRATALVDGRPVASTAVGGLGGVKARLALGCRGARCRFSNLRLAGALGEARVAAGGTR